MLSELAIDNMEAFKDLVIIAKDALAGKSYTPKVEKTEEKKESKTTSEKKTSTTKKSESTKKSTSTTKKTTKKEEK